MRILTFGWDYPPMKNGGLGVACHGLTEELLALGLEIIFVLPREQSIIGNQKFIFACTIPKIIRVNTATLVPYQQSQSLIRYFNGEGKQICIDRRILDEVYRYAEAAKEIASAEQFDIIHAHDWTSYLAGVAAKAISGKPLVLHVHATSFDQAASDHVDPDIFSIEKQAFEIADSVVTVSNFTKNVVVEKYNIDPKKIAVVHNGIKLQTPRLLPPALGELKSQGKKIVFYNGRITIQKGVDYFIYAARKVVDFNPDVIFVISGWGDMEHQIMHLVGSLGLSSNVIFAGALWDEDRDRMYQSADLLVMPSVSEPFGLVPLEAIQQGTPVLISKQSGVSEVLAHVLKVDFWDIDEMANKIIAALKYPVLNKQLVEEGKKELTHITWGHAARRVVEIYKKLLDWFTQGR